MLAGFDWWLLVLGIVGGGGLVWLLLADFRRSDGDLAADEASREADLIAEQIAREAETDGRPGGGLDRAAVERVLELHRAYLTAPAPDLDELDDAAWLEAHPEAGGGVGAED
jgi:hypothetical protein